MLLAILFTAVLLFPACNSTPDFANQELPFMEIQNGQFEVDAILTINSADTGGMLLGSGSVSFSFSGDTSGTYSAAGSLLLNQSDTSGVGAILNRIENLDLNTVDEGFTLLAFFPTGDGKTDILTIGTKLFSPVDTLQQGFVYGIGPNSAFLAAYFKGLQISDFWSGQANFFDASEKAFNFTLGTVFISERDSTHITGTFAATTDPNRSSETGIIF